MNEINSNQEPIASTRNTLDETLTPSNMPISVRPQPAPRLSITSSRSPSNQSLVQSKVNELENIYGRCITPSDSLNLSTKCLRSPSKEFSPGELELLFFFCCNFVVFDKRLKNTSLIMPNKKCCNYPNARNSYYSQN